MRGCIDIRHIDIGAYDQCMTTLYWHIDIGVQGTVRATAIFSPGQASTLPLMCLAAMYGPTPKSPA